MKKLQIKSILLQSSFLFILAFLVLSNFAYAQTDNESDSKGDKKEGLHAGGGLWGFKLSAKSIDNDSTSVLLIGDSILNGYGSRVADSIKNVAKVDFWTTGKHLNSEGLISELKARLEQKKYAVIHFNIGLHGWQEGRIPDGQYVPLLETYVRTLKDYASQAKLIWASTTPVTESGNPVLNKEINPIIVERNTLTAEVMKNNNIAVNDLYAVVVNRLNLAKLDRFHWFGEGYQLMANQISKYILAELK